MSWPRLLIQPPRRAISIASAHPVGQYRLLHSAAHIATVPCLASWDVEAFRQQAFVPETPHRLPRSAATLPPACKSWFIHDTDSDLDLEIANKPPEVSELRHDVWHEYGAVLVPLELGGYAADNAEEEYFERAMVPLNVLLDQLSNTRAPKTVAKHRNTANLYLAQCPLSSLPAALQEAVPKPELIKAGKGDVYDSSLWMGRPPTYTPLHRDPNPNVFIQLAGRKTVRLLPPSVGDVVFERVQHAIRGRAHASFRGDEMMVGKERDIFEQGIWAADNRIGVPALVAEINAVVSKYGQEANLVLGEGLFIPKGWWHSVKGVGDGITASVNWWFR